MAVKRLKKQKYIQDYINYRIDNKISAWTIKMEASAIAKMYGSSTSELKLITPERKRENICFPAILVNMTNIYLRRK